MARAIEVSEAEAKALFESGHLVSASTPDKLYQRRYFSSAATENYGVDRFENLGIRAQATTHFSTVAELEAHIDDPVTYYKRVGTPTNDDAAGFVFRREAFDIQALSARFIEWGYDGELLVGDLPPEDVLDLEEAVREGAEQRKDVYVVYSYSTPIAWLLMPETLTMPRVRYSLTTTSHQHLVARAFGQTWSSWAGKRAPSLTGKSPYGPRAGNFGVTR